MKKKVLSVLSYVLVALVASGTTLACALFFFREGTGKLQQVQDLLQERFIEEVDQDALEDAAAQAMVEALGDRWSYYMTAEEYLSYQDTMSNSYVGVGITVQLREDRQGFDILKVEPKGPANEAGVRAGDRLVAVNGTSVLDAQDTSVLDPIKGEEGTTVELTLVRGEEELTLTVERRRFDTQVATYQMLEDQIGLVTILNFDERCAQETIAAVEELLDQGAQALIFDVRYNPGGYKRELVEILDYLLPEGPLFRTVDYQGREEVDESDENFVDVPMAVVMNLHSYSAAEFFAAALSEYEAAFTVGEKTYGKGYFQNTFQLSDGSAVNLSVGKYYTPKGVSLAGVGLTPDVPVEVDEQTAAKIQAGTLDPAEDPQIQAAVNRLKDGK